SILEHGEVGAFSFGVDPWKHPSYSKPDSFKEKEITIGSEYKLSGVMTIPEGSGPFPAVVLVHDSGAGDRGEAVGAVKVFKDLAEGLSSQGIIVLRYEKRTRAFPSVAIAKDYTPDTETIEDAVMAAAVLRAQPEVKQGKVFALGYGLGGYLMPRIA